VASHQIHALGGIAAGGATLGGLHHWLGRPLEPVGASLFLLVGVLAALFPDVDTESRGRDIFYGIFFLLDLVLIGFKQYTFAAFLGLLAIVPILSRHRGWTHTWWAMLLVPLPLVLLPALFLKADPRIMAPYYICAVLGYFSHLLLDWKFR